MDMELSIFLAQLLGLYFVLAGAIFILRQKSLIPAVQDAGSNRGLILLLASLELLAGLALVIAHPIYTLDWQGIITFIGAWMIVESIFFLILPNKIAKGLISMVNKPLWYSIGGLIAIVIGAYLAGVGFGLI